MSHPVTPVAVVGCGYWGKNLVRNFHSLGSLRAICDLDESRLVDLEKTYGVKGTRSFDEVLCQAEILSIVIAAPAAQYFEFARKALLAGKDVFVEKPLALRVHFGRDALCRSIERHGLWRPPLAFGIPLTSC